MKKKKIEVGPSCKTFMKKAYKILDHKDFIVHFSNDPVYNGMCYYEQGIEINITGPIIPTIVHELLHYMYISASEKKVKEMTARIIDKISITAARTLLYKVIASEVVTRSAKINKLT